LSYDFPPLCAKIEPPHATPFWAGCGSGWIANGLLTKDRLRVRAATVFAMGLNEDATAAKAWLDKHETQKG